MEQQMSYLNRSFSESDIYSNSPYYRRVEVEEHILPYQPQNYDTPHISKIRRYSFIQQIVPNSSDLDTLKSNCSTVDNKSRSAILFEHNSTYANNPFIQINRNVRYEERFCPNTPENYDFKDNPKCEILAHNKETKFDIESHKSDIDDQETPMDTDDYEYINEHYTDNYDETDGHDEYIEEQTQLRRLNEIHIPPKQTKHQASLTILVIICAILFVGVAWLYNSIFIETPLVEKREADLGLDKILYQDHVKDVTIRNFNKLQSGVDHKKMLVFVGSTGVGKTYTVNLIRKHFPKKFVIDVNFLLEPYLMVNNIETSMRSDGCYFITIDDLKIDNLKTVLTYIEKLPDKCALIVPIFNIHDVDDKFVYTINNNHFKDIQESFNKKFSPYVDIVLFNDINRDILEIWLKDQIGGNSLVNEEDAIISLLDEHDVKTYGFKGLSAKLNLLVS